MQWLAELCVKRPVFATVLSLVILVVGSVFYRQLGVDQFPKIDFPVIVVTTIQPGSSPEDMEREVSDKLEGAVNTISGIDELRSTSAEGVSQVIIQFVLEKNVDVASQEVQQKVNTVLAELPKGIDPPVVLKFEPDAHAGALRGLARAGQDGARGDRHRRPRGAPPARVGQRRRQGRAHRRPQAPDRRAGRPGEAQGPGHLARSRWPAPSTRRTSPCPAGASTPAATTSPCASTAGWSRSTSCAPSSCATPPAAPSACDEIATVVDGVQDADTGAMWNGERTVLLALQQAVGHQHGGRGRRHQGPHARRAEGTAARLQARGAARRLGRGAHRHRGGHRAPHSRRHLRGHHRAALPGQPAQHHHRRPRHPHLDHRHLRADEAAGATRSTPSPCWRWRWRWASSSTTPSWCSRTSSASSRRRA